MFQTLYQSTSWWFQPIWKILVKLDHFRRDRGEHKKKWNHHLDLCFFNPLFQIYCQFSCFVGLVGLPPKWGIHFLPLGGWVNSNRQRATSRLPLGCSTLGCLIWVSGLLCSTIFWISTATPDLMGVFNSRGSPSKETCWEEISQEKSEIRILQVYLWWVICEELDNNIKKLREIYIYMGSGRFPGPMELLLQQLVRVSKTRWRWFNLNKSMLLQPLIKKLEVLVMINQWTTYCINENNDERWIVVLFNFSWLFVKINKSCLIKC